MTSLTPLPLKIAYIDGGNRDWARKLIIDLAPRTNLSGEIARYDIALELINYLYIFRNDYLPAATVIYQWMPS